MSEFKQLMKAKRLSRRHFLGVAATVTTSAWWPVHAQTRAADWVLYNGEVHTVDAQNRRVSAIAVAGNRILATGSDRQINQWVGGETRRIDLQGRTVLPGINDSHLHLMGWGSTRPPFALDVTSPNVSSIADCVEAVRQAVVARPKGEWIIGRGWDEPYLREGRTPHAQDLDAVAPDHPVALTDFSGHAVWANSRAMQLAGIGPDTQPPPGGVIVRDDDGQATGILFEGAAWMLKEIIPEPTAAQRIATIKAAMAGMLSRGVTSCTEPGLSPVDLALYNDLAGQDFVQKMRVSGLVMAGRSTDMLAQALAGHGVLQPVNEAFFRMPGVKIMGDGIPTGNETAWLHDPYESGGNGSLLIEGADHAERATELSAMIQTIHSAGLQIGTHATGDRSIDTVVAAYQLAQKAQPRHAPRHYVIHADLVSAATLKLMAAGTIGANFNPEIKHLIADSQKHSIGPVRAAYEWPYRSALDAGVNVASSSDAPVTPGNWLQGIATMLDRRGKQSGEVSGPEQRINLDEAVRTYTMAGAWQDHAETYKGSLEVGKVADLCVLNDRLSSVTPESMAATEVSMTLVDGMVVYET